MASGRNDPCHCGSGKKYKICCLKKDQQANRERNAETQRKLLLAQETTIRNPQPPPKPIPTPPSRPVDPQTAAINAKWEEFDTAGYPQQAAIFTEILPDECILDDDLALNMLERLFTAACQHHDIARFDLLVGALRERRPEIYEAHTGYILSWQIDGALIEGRGDAADRWAREFAFIAGENIDSFRRTIDRLAYHGRLDTLVAMARVAWPSIRESRHVVPWAKDAYAMAGWRWELYQHLAAALPEAPAAEICEFFAGQQLDGAADIVLAHLRGEQQQDCDAEDIWDHIDSHGSQSDDDFGWADEEDDEEFDEDLANDDEELDEEDEVDEEVDAIEDDEPLPEEDRPPYPFPLALVTYDFVSYLHTRTNVPLAKAELARKELVDYLTERHIGRLEPRQSMMDALMKRPKPKPHRKPVHPLCPDRSSLNIFLAGLIRGVFNTRLHAAAALFAVIPQWLEFLEQRGAIDSKRHATVLMDVATLVDDMADGMRKVQFDPALSDNIRAGWSANIMSPAAAPTA